MLWNAKSSYEGHSYSPAIIIQLGTIPYLRDSQNLWQRPSVSQECRNFVAVFLKECAYTDLV